MILQNPKLSLYSKVHIYLEVFLIGPHLGHLGFPFVSLLQSQVGVCVFVSSVCQ